MAKLQGTILASKIVPTDSLDTYATHEDKYGRGGHRSVDTLEERDNITTPRRKEGMTVYVKENKTKYILENGVENTDWKVDSSGGSGGGDVDLSDYYKKTETYSKVEVDTKISDIPTTDLSNYYDKTETYNKNEVDNLIDNIPETDLTNYYTKSETYNKVETDSLVKSVVDSLGSFTESLTQNGWTKLPNGLIIQWATVIESTTATDYKAFPIAFPNACLSAILQLNSSAPGGLGLNVGTIIKIIDNTKFIWTAGGSYAGGGVAYMIAIGY